MVKRRIYSLLVPACAWVTPAFAQSSYEIPDNLTPVSKWAHGFTAEQAEHYRTTYSAPDIIAGNDMTAFAYLNLSEVVPTAVIRSGGPISELKALKMPEIGEVVATPIWAP